MFFCPCPNHILWPSLLANFYASSKDGQTRERWPTASREKLVLFRVPLLLLLLLLVLLHILQQLPPTPPAPPSTACFLGCQRADKTFFKIIFCI